MDAIIRLSRALCLGSGLLLSAAQAPCLAKEQPIADVLKTAVGGSGEARYVAIDDLGERHEAANDVVPALGKLLDDKDGQVRWRSARALGDFGPLAKAAAPKLSKLLAEDDPIVRYHAAVSLGRIGDRSDATTRVLVRAVTGKDERVARAAIAALRNLEPDPKTVMDVLEEALASDDDAVALHAMQAAVERGAAAVPMLNEALQRPKTAYVACAAIEQIGADAAPTVPALTELLSDTAHSHLQIEALLALASIGPAAKSAAPKIVPLLTAKNDKTVPVAAAYSLGSIGAADADAKLRDARASDDPFLAMIAAWSLAKIHPDDQSANREAVQKLTQGLRSKDPAIRAAAARSLHSLQAPPEIVVPELIAAADDPDPEVSENVASALASLGEQIVPKASKALEDAKLRELAVDVLTKLGPKAKGAVQPLIGALQGASPEFRTDIHVALAAIGPDAAAATAALADAIESEDERVQESALYALKQIGPGAAAAKPALLARMQAGESFDALAAGWALATIAPNDAAISAKAVPLATQGLSSPDEHVRLHSAEALGAWGKNAKSATPLLQRIAAEDSSLAVRDAAETALSKIQGRNAAAGE